MTDDKRYVIKLFDRDFNALAALFATDSNSGENLCKPAFLEWQYDANPFGKAIIIGTYSVENHDLVGVYIVNPTSLSMNGAPVRAALSLNTFTRSDFRGLGLFPKMAAECYAQAEQQEIDCIIGFPNEASYGGFVKKLSFKDLGSVAYLIKSLNPFRTGIRLAFNTLQEVPSPEVTNARSTEAFDIHELFASQNERLFEKFWEACSKQHQTTSWRTWEFLLWRYRDNPVHTYTALAIKDAEKISAIIIYSLHRNERLLDAHIVDFCSLSDERSIRAAEVLLGSTMKTLRNAKVDVVKALGQPDTVEGKLLRRAGFFPKNLVFKKSNTPFIYRQKNMEAPSPNFANWHIVFGDSDVV